MQKKAKHGAENSHHALTLVGNQEHHICLGMKIKAARINGLEVSVCGVGELPDFSGQGVTHVVSLWDGYEAESPEPRFRIDAIFPEAKTHFGFFNDVFNESDSSFAPHRDAIRDILDFTSGLSSGDYLLLHCAVGVSRSTAFAYAALCQHAGPGYEEDCFRALKWIRPSASPNPLVVQWADDLLGRGGAMVEGTKTRMETDCHLQMSTNPD